MGWSSEPLEIERGIRKAAALAILVPVVPSQHSSEINGPGLEVVFFLLPEWERPPCLTCMVNSNNV